MYVALDSNILIQNISKENQNRRILNDYVRKTESKIIIHEIVEAEVLGRLKENVSKDLLQIEAAIHKVKKYNITDLPVLNFKAIRNKNLEKTKKDFLDNLYNENTLRVKIDGRALREVIRRSVERKRPCSKNGEELRDAIIWLNLLQYCKKINHDFAFISNNTNDFAGEDKKTLHNDLMDDIRHHKIEVQYFTSLEDFLREHAEPIADINFDWVHERIDMASVKSIIMGFILYNEVSRYFTPCNFSDRDYFVPEGKPELPLWASPRFEFEDFFVWRFDDRHVELSLIFYAYIEAEFNCVPKDYSTFHHSFHPCHESYPSVLAASHSHFTPNTSYSDLCTSNYHTITRSYHTTITDRKICFADLKFRISAKIEGDKILLESIEDLYKN